jgi:hypothetical protein
VKFRQNLKISIFYNIYGSASELSVYFQKTIFLMSEVFDSKMENNQNLLKTQSSNAYSTEIIYLFISFYSGDLQLTFTKSNYNFDEHLNNNLHSW